MREQLHLLRNRAIEPVLSAYIEATWRRRAEQRASHNLGAPLVVSLTSYPPRFRTLARTIKALLSQSVRADATVLWVAEGDFGQLPDDVLALRECGLEINLCEDLGSYKKLIPTLEKHPDWFVATADDDLYFWQSWLKELVTAFIASRPGLVCHRAHRIRLTPSGKPAAYADWQHEIGPSAASPDVFPTSGAGVLYPPGCFHSDISRAARFRQLCPTADDIWFYWMSRLNGAVFRKVGPVRRLMPWATSQRVSLYDANVQANDVQIANMMFAYGLPGPDE